jgi:sugar (pentulose or hexulose) kinase
VSDSRPGADEDRLLLGCDVGTSAVKTVLMTAGGDLLARRSAEHAMHHPRPGWAENNPDDWYQGLAHTIRGVLRDAEVPPERVAAISVVAQREPVVLVDVQGAALCPAISWTDRRTGAEAREVADRFGRSWLIAKTGMVPVAGASLPQMLWLRRHRQDDWRRAHKILLAKDYVVSRLTGELTTDVSTPGRSLMLDIGQGEWCSEICDAFEIDRERLAAIATEPWEQIGELTATAAEQLGLTPGTRWRRAVRTMPRPPWEPGRSSRARRASEPVRPPTGAASSISHAPIRAGAATSHRTWSPSATSTRWPSRAPALHCAGSTTHSPRTDPSTS